MHYFVVLFLSENTILEYWFYIVEKYLSIESILEKNILRQLFVGIYDNSILIDLYFFNKNRSYGIQISH